MAVQATIAERPVPPKGRLSFPALLVAITTNPIAGWGEDFYEEPIIHYRWLGLETLFVMDPELIQAILLDDTAGFSKQPLYDNVLGQAIGGGLLNAEGAEWRWQRRLAAPLFRPEEVAAYVPVFVTECERLLERWGKAPAGSVQSVHSDIAGATLEILVRTLLGSDLSAEDSRAMYAAGTAFLQPTVWKIAYTALKLPSWTPHPGILRMRQAGQMVRRVSERALAKRRASGNPGSDLLGRLMTAKDPGAGTVMPDSLIVDNIVTYLLAGHETTAKALTWSLHVLALMPEWQERARAEVLAVTGGRPIRVEQLAELKLLEAIFLEAMRLYPPAPSLMRRATRRTQLGDVVIGEGASIVIPTYVVHRHRSIWPDPLRFDPSRFTQEARTARHRCAYMPFSAGPRSCIGGSFSMLGGKALLATLLAGARFELPAGELPTPVARITLESKPSISLKVTLLRD